MRRILILLSISFIAAFVGCDNGNSGGSTKNTTTVTDPPQEPKAPAVLNYGVQTGASYDNDYFGLKVTLPEDWYIQSREENAEIEQGGSATPKSIEALQTIYLLWGFMHEPGSVVEYNAGINIVAANLSQVGQGSTEDDYLVELLKNLANIPNYSIPDKTISDMKVGGITMRSANGQTTIDGIKISQQYLVVFRKGYAIQITTSWSNEVQRTQLMNILKNIAFY
ncbi:MAG: hypothetical protein R3D00_17055 [Bacteroidia bacterium]